MIPSTRLCSGFLDGKLCEPVQRVRTLNSILPHTFVTYDQPGHLKSHWHSSEERFEFNLICILDEALFFSRSRGVKMHRGSFAMSKQVRSWPLEHVAAIKVFVSRPLKVYIPWMFCSYGILKWRLEIALRFSALLSSIMASCKLIIDRIWVKSVSALCKAKNREE